MTPLVIGFLAAHFTLAQLLPTPWWTPNLTVIGLLFATVRKPQHWWLWAALCGTGLALGMVRFPVWMIAASAALAYGFQWCTRRWNANEDWHVQALMVLAGTLGMMLFLFWLDGAWSLKLLRPLAEHLAATLAAYVVARRIVAVREA